MFPIPDIPGRDEMEPELEHRRYTAEEFVYERPADERSELVGGWVVMEPPPGIEHGSWAARLTAYLLFYAEPRQLGRVIGEAGYILERGPDTVRGPDVSFVTTERWRQAIDRTGYFEGAPDLAIEVASPGDAHRHLAAKATSYLRSGSRLVWVVWPIRRSIEVFSPGAPPFQLSGADVLDSGEVLPGFRLPVSRVFEDF